VRPFALEEVVAELMSRRPWPRIIVLTNSAKTEDLRRSQRELQVLKHMGIGKSNKEIGQILYISEYTVKSQVKVILKKLNAIGRTEAIAIASERGLIIIG
jgi:DNA-binding NarL/FixJ family response regulator